MTEPSAEQLSKWNAELDATPAEARIAGPIRVRIVEAQSALDLIGREIVADEIIRCVGARPGNRNLGWWNIKAPGVKWWPTVHFVLLDWPARRAWHRCTDKSHCNGLGEMWHGPGCNRYENGVHAVAERYPCACGLTYKQAQERGFIPGKQRRDEPLCNTCWNTAALAPGQTCPKCAKAVRSTEPHSLAATDRVRIIGAHLKHAGQVGSVLYASPVADRFEVEVGGAVLEFERDELEYVGAAQAKSDRYHFANNEGLERKLRERRARIIPGLALEKCVEEAMYLADTAGGFARPPATSPRGRLLAGLAGELDHRHAARERRRWERITGPCHPITNRPRRK